MKRKNIPPILTIDNYNSSINRYDNGKFSRTSKLKRGKNDTVISYIANRDLIIELIELSSNLPQEHIKDIITDKAYEELRLDTAVEYEVYPIKTALRGDSVKYQALIADVNSIKSTFAELAKKVKYLDYLIPAPLLYKVLYQDRLLDDSSTDMFIYFGDYDTFITFYYKGEFLYSKSINFSLNHIYDRFCQLAQEVPFTKEQFRELLSTNGLKADNKEHRELLIRVFNECFLTINDIIVYLKRSYDISKIKKAFVGFSWGYTDGIEVFFKNYLNINSKPIVTIYTQDDPKVAIDPIHSLMRLTAIDLEQESLDLPNLTPYPKPKPFLQRPAGKIIMTFLGISLLGLAPSAYEYIIGLSYNGKNLILEKKERRLTQEANKYKALLKKKDEEIKSLDKIIEKISKEYNRRRGEITKVYDKKFKYSLKSEQLTLLTDILKKYEIVSSNIRVDGDEYFVEVESDSEKKITTFVKSVVANFNKDIKNINIEDITYNKDEKVYKGTLKVTFQKGRK